ncbi:titin homolog [Diaphorina citri]|uniref:Titin homolog n=1 Tax=Diaphorina citri TaxID=121845 RepID=A0A3Q0JN35_DIACI|nr:titin homolog [Diaphorina citri]
MDNHESSDDEYYVLNVDTVNINKVSVSSVSQEMQDIPFYKVGIEIVHWAGTDYLVLIDYYSRWIEIRKMLTKRSTEDRVLVGKAVKIVKDMLQKCTSEVILMLEVTWNLQVILMKEHTLSVQILLRSYRDNFIKMKTLQPDPWITNDNNVIYFDRVLVGKAVKIVKDMLQKCTSEGMATEEKYNDIRFNLMAVVPDKRLAISHKLTLLKANRTIVLEVLDKMKRKKPGDEEEEEEEEVEETGDVNTSPLLCAPKPLPSDQPSPNAAPSADSKKRKLSPDDENQSDTDKKPSDKKLKQEEDNQSDNKPDKNSSDKKLKQDEDNPSDNKPDKKLKQDDDNPSSDKKSSDDKPDKKSSDDKPDKKSSDKPEKKSSGKPDKKEEDSQMSEEAGEEKEVDCAVPDGDGGEKGMEGGEVKEEKTGGGDGQSEDVDKAAGKSDITDDNKVKSSESVEAEVAAGSSQNKMEVTAESGICLFRILDLYCGYNYNLYISMYTNTR